MTDYYFWNNFWTNVRRKEDRYKYQNEICKFHEMTLSEFKNLSEKAKNILLNEYMKNKDKQSGSK